MLTQKGYLDQLNALASKYKCITICAGDVFDKWNPNPELINFLLDNLPYGFHAVPGQHDLPYHNFEDWHRSGFGTLVKSNKLTMLYPDGATMTHDLIMYGFPWGYEVKRCPHGHGNDQLDSRPKLAVIHHYCWTKSANTYPGSDDNDQLAVFRKVLKGYSAALFGDNHKGFLINKKPKKCPVLNPGSFMCRKLDERDHKPCVGLLHADSSIKRHYLDTSKDRWVDLTDSKNKELLRAEEFLEELARLGDTYLDFREALNRFFKTEQVSNAVQKVILKAMDS